MTRLQLQFWTRPARSTHPLNRLGGGSSSSSRSRACQSWQQMFEHRPKTKREPAAPTENTAAAAPMAQTGGKCPGKISYLSLSRPKLTWTPSFGKVDLAGRTAHRALIATHCSSGVEVSCCWKTCKMKQHSSYCAACLCPGQGWSEMRLQNVCWCQEVYHIRCLKDFCTNMYKL